MIVLINFFNWDGETSIPPEDLKVTFFSNKDESGMFLLGNSKYLDFTILDTVDSLMPMDVAICLSVKGVRA